MERTPATSNKQANSAELVKQAKVVLEMATERHKILNQLIGTLKKLSDPEFLDSPSKVKSATKLLESEDLNNLSWTYDWTNLTQAVVADQAQRTAARKVTFGHNLKKAAERLGLDCKLITTDPIEFGLAPFSVIVDLAANQATLQYSKLAVKELPADPDQILEVHQKISQELEKRWPAEHFFDALLTAYQFQLYRQRLPTGERVDLVDLLGTVALTAQGKRFKSNPEAANFKPYSRYMFAYDIARLRRTGLLQRNGWRLNLGTATSGSTRNKKDVLYLETILGQGQYYLTVWFSQATERKDC